MSRVLFASLAVAWASLAACYKTPNPECAFACELGGDETCPSGYTCRPDNLCKRADVSDGFACPDTDTEVDAAAPDAPEADATEIDAMEIDATEIDATEIDAPDIDAAVDAPIDAEIDAPIDAEIDAPTDA